MRKKSGLRQRKVEVRGVLRAYKIRAYPTGDQRRVLHKWRAAACRIYNIGKDRVKGMGKISCGRYIEIRKTIVPAKIISSGPPEQRWLAETPSKVRELAFKDLVDAHNACVEKSGLTGKRCVFGYRSFRRAPTGSFKIEKATDHDRGPIHSFTMSERRSGSTQKSCAVMNMAPDIFRKEKVSGAIEVRDREWLIEKLVGDGKLLENATMTWERATNRWHVVVLVESPIKDIATVDPDTARVVSLDPGEVSFNEYYSPNGEHGELLVGFRDYIREVNETRDSWISRKDRLVQQHRQDVRGMNPDRPRQGRYRRTISHLNRRIGRTGVATRITMRAIFFCRNSTSS